jgi:4-diphosphocytidyl-2-C-methyl-D-erythritol kinase
MRELKFKANAKINLFLEVLDKRPDGYHNIETVFQSIHLHDLITLREDSPHTAPGIQITCDNPQVPLDSSNLVYKASELLMIESGKQFSAKIHIDKKIPVGGGLAGGSTNAAATLVGLNELWELGYSLEHLMEIGVRLGADVPFCIMGGTALGRERGDELTKLKPIPEIPVVIVNPGFQVSTAWAYNNLSKLGLTKGRKSANILITKMQKRDIPDIAEGFFNVFERVVFPEYPIVQKLKEELLRFGAAGTLMTGSGPTVFGFVSDESIAREIREKLGNIADFCIVTKTTNASIIRM